MEARNRNRAAALAFSTHGFTMTDIRRTILWVVFSMSMLMLWDRWQLHQGQPSLFGGLSRPQATATSTSPPASAASGVPSAAPPQVASLQASTFANPATAPVQAAAIGELVSVSTDTVKATFDSMGGQLTRLELLLHADHGNGGAPVVLFDRSSERLYLAQTGLITNRAGLALPNHTTPMKIVEGRRTLAPGQDALTLRFEGESGGVKLATSYTFQRGSYAVAVKQEITNAGAAPVAPLLYVQLLRDGNPPKGESSMYFTFTGPALYTDANKFRKIDFKDIEKGKAEHDRSATDGWIAMIQHYFASAWVLPPGQAREYRTTKVAANQYAIAMVADVGELAPGATKAIDATLYAGPQEEYKLAALSPGLDLVKDYGWFRILAQPLFWLLDKLHGVLGNWGWAIVSLVVLLKLAFYSLNASAYRSMAKMKAINPRVMELRERYKDKPQQMQQEMMRIYKEEKVNPVGGCLPIVAQMPFFIALYWVLLSSAEMRNAPWIGWIKDLSAPDTLFGVIPWLNMPVGPLPLLMMGSSILQVALGAKPPDPMQARMMWMMPIAFGFMFFFFPSGLVLYWLTNNILSIAQQWYINRKFGLTLKS
jgi:YidC/Oxa1 family membrane protein insertase